MRVLRTAVINKGERSLESRLWLLLHPVLPGVIGRDKMFLIHRLLLATNSLEIVHRHSLRHKTRLWLHKIAREWHHLRRKRSCEIVARLLNIRHELARLWCQV